MQDVPVYTFSKLHSFNIYFGRYMYREILRHNTPHNLQADPHSEQAKGEFCMRKSSQIKLLKRELLRKLQLNDSARNFKRS